MGACERFTVAEDLYIRRNYHRMSNRKIGEVLGRSEHSIQFRGRALGVTKKVDQMAATLCWECKNAVPSGGGENGCNWSVNGQPVIGWKAKKVNLNIASGASEPGGETRKKVVTSYCVKKCPLFEEG